ncbi:hypothetical protein [Adonisia turfae]|uniref:hypothetical protein n=1 Tax=Adonisia turfae TaxID=2950184 RepID=UPI002029A4BB|nr:hypothetical protein [Adonisia turfae]
MRASWDKAGEEPEEPGREHLANAAIEAIRQANQTGDWVGLRKQWPPAHQPFIHLLQENHADDELSLDLSMEHGTLSKDGHLIAVGAQNSCHLVFDAQLNLISEIGPHSEYPHYALFSADGRMVAFNACHFYNGTTIGILTDALKGMKTDFYEEDNRIAQLEDGARVYAGVSHQDEFIVGDASGYIRAFSIAGDFRWQLFIGSAISSMDLSSDGKTLVVSTYAGFLSIIQLGAGTPAPN